MPREPDLSPATDHGEAYARETRSRVITLEDRIGDVRAEQARIGAQLEGIEKSSEERHQQTTGTITTAKDGIDKIRSMMQEENARRADADAARVRAESEAALARWALLKEPRTQLLLAVVLLAVVAPQTLPMLIDAGKNAVWGIPTPVSEAPALLDGNGGSAAPAE